MICCVQNTIFINELIINKSFDLPTKRGRAICGAHIARGIDTKGQLISSDYYDRLGMAGPRLWTALIEEVAVVRMRLMMMNIIGTNDCMIGVVECAVQMALTHYSWSARSSRTLQRNSPSHRAGTGVVSVINS